MTDLANRIAHAARTAEGFYLPAEGETCFMTRDGSDAAAWLAAQGFEVLGNYDTGRNGLVFFKAEGVLMQTSSNGYTCPANVISIEKARAAGINA